MTPEPVGDRTGSSRWFPPPPRLLVALAAVLAAVLAGLLVVLAVVSGGDDDRATSAASGTSSSAEIPGHASSSSEAAAPASTSPTPSYVPGSADELPPALPQVALADTAAVGDRVSVEVASVERFQGEATGPGNVSGPAVRVTLRITNGTADPLDLDAVSVNVSHGPDATPAPPLDDVSRAPFSGTVAPGATAEGRYVFSVPSGALDPAIVEVGYRPGAPLALFVGPVA